MKTLTSTIALSRLPPYTPLAVISSLAPFLVFALFSGMTSEGLLLREQAGVQGVRDLEFRGQGVCSSGGKGSAVQGTRDLQFRGQGICSSGGKGSAAQGSRGLQFRGQRSAVQGARGLQLRGKGSAARGLLFREQGVCSTGVYRGLLFRGQGIWSSVLHFIPPPPPPRLSTFTPTEVYSMSCHDGWCTSNLSLPLRSIHKTGEFILVFLVVGYDQSSDKAT